jgi:hypothetical protein
MQIQAKIHKNATAATQATKKINFIYINSGEDLIDRGYKHLSLNH